MPILVFIIILYGVYKKINIYDRFIEGSKESFDIIITMFPPMLAMIFGVNIMIKSGFIDYIFMIFKWIKIIPIDVFPMMLLRPISGSVSLATLNK